MPPPPPLPSFLPCCVGVISNWNRLSGPLVPAARGSRLLTRALRRAGESSIRVRMDFGTVVINIEREKRKGFAAVRVAADESCRGTGRLDKILIVAFAAGSRSVLELTIFLTFLKI